MELVLHIWKATLNEAALFLLLSTVQNNTTWLDVSFQSSLMNQDIGSYCGRKLMVSVTQGQTFASTIGRAVGFCSGCLFWHPLNWAAVDSCAQTQLFKKCLQYQSMRYFSVFGETGMKNIQKYFENKHLCFQINFKPLNKPRLWYALNPLVLFKGNSVLQTLSLTFLCMLKFSAKASSLFLW